VERDVRGAHWTVSANPAKPRPMFDIKSIRENPDAFDAGLARRGLNPRAGEILALDEDARKFTHALNDMQERRNASS